MPKYAGWVHNGTKPHLIVAKRKKLRFFWRKKGVFVQAFKVRHPGMRAYPYLRNALVSEIKTLR